MADRVNVKLDLFPARVSVASTSFGNVRAVIADDTLKLFSLTGSGIRVVYDKPITDIDGRISFGITANTEDGQITIEADGGCGCGSQLKIADLFPGQVRVMVPLT